jgi:hypothetical protein
MKLIFSLEQPRFINKFVTALFLSFFILMLMHQSVNAVSEVPAPVFSGTSITFNVIDSYNNKVNGGDITLNSTTLPFPLKFKDDGFGRYYIINLPVGDYSVTVSAPGYVPSSSISIGTLNLNENNSRIVQLTADSSQVGINDLYFYDSNNSKDIIAGTVNWNTYGNLPSDAQIQVQLFDDKNAPVGPPLTTINASLHQCTITDTTLTTGATRIGVQLISNTSVIGQKTLPMWGGIYLYPPNLKFIDSNSNLGITGSISWSGLTDETQIGGYRIYYRLKDLTCGNIGM